MNAKKYKKVIMLLVLCLILSVMVPMRMMHADAEDEMPDDDLSGSAVAVLPEETVETSEKPAENVEKAEETESEEETPVPSETAAPAESEDPEEDLSGSATAATNVTATPAPSPSESPAPAETEQPVSTPSPAVSASPAPTATPEPTANAVAADSQTARDIAYSQPALINRPTGVTPGSSSVIISQPSAVANPIIREDFRFYTVARKYAFAKEDLKIRVQMNDDGTPAGSLAQGGLCYVLKEEGNGWDYVESGKVRGFVQAELLQTGEEAEELLEQYQEEARKLAESKNTAYSGIESVAMTAETELDPMENEAFTYLKATVNPTVCTKIYALAKEDLPILEEGNSEAREIGSVKKGGLLYIITDRFNDWVYVESGDARGFVPKKSIKTGGVRKAVLTKGEDTFETAVTTVKPSENKAVYYTLTSIQSGVPVGKLRKSILDFAAQYIGNPYVWGGTSLENGADCSGFVQAIYANYGYFLPRVAEDQAEVGTKIPVGDAKPGDLIFYARNGYIYHVVMYAGDGQTIEAHSSATGIIRGTVNYANAVWATRVLKDVDEFSADINEQNATEDMYGQDLGEFKITYYCACEICCDVETGITATGAPVVQGETIAVDPRVIPYGTKVIINGHVFTAEDCGGAIKGNRIDIYVDDHATAQALGVNHYHVYLTR